MECRNNCNGQLFKCKGIDDYHLLCDCVAENNMMLDEDCS